MNITQEETNKITKSKEYFGKREEDAIKLYLKSADFVERNQLFASIIEPALRELVRGVLRMPQFQTMTSAILRVLGLNKEELEEDTYYHVVFQLEKYDPNRIGKNGQLVKAYSYYGTCAKNYILQKKQEVDKLINQHGGLLDVDEYADRIAETPSQTKEFEELKKQLVYNLEQALAAKKLSKNDVIVGNTLKYMLANWNKLEFQTKNEFVRLLCHYTQLKPPIVARSLKKFKLLAYDNFFGPPKKQKKRLHPKHKS